MNLRFTLLALLCSAISFAQSIQEKDIPAPDEANYFDFGPFQQPTISYGAQPQNYNGKVLFFTQGYLDLMETQFLIDNKFYQMTYDQGYQAVFITTTRGGDVWENSSIITKALDMVTEKLNVQDVIYIGHSNGAKEGDVAMVLNNKQDKVSKIFALGTPFKGTRLANIAESPVLGWIWDLTGLSGGSATSTTRFCKRLMRQLKRHSNNEPDKIVVLGASGFYRGSTIANLVFQVSGRILGGRRVPNDGVATYRSTLRPGAEYVFRKNDPRARFDHWDVSLGQKVWPYIKPYIDNENFRSNIHISEEEKSMLEDDSEVSDYFIAYSENSYDNTITLDKGTSSASVEIFHEKKSGNYSLLSDHKLIQSGKLSKTHNTHFEISQSNLKLTSDSKYLAFVRPHNDITMKLHGMDLDADYPELNISFHSVRNPIVSSHINVTGVLTRITSIDAKEERGEPIVVNFERHNDDSFYLNIRNLEDGIYNIMIHGNSKDNFKRSLVTTFVVGDMKAAIDTYQSSYNHADLNAPAKKANLTIFPTLIKNQAHLSIPSTINRTINNATIYSFNGSVIKRFKIDPRNRQNISISEEITSLRSGIYILEVEGIGTTKFIKQ